MNWIILSIYFQVLMEQNLANKILSYVWWNDVGVQNTMEAQRILISFGQGGIV
jgi:hypothetical protein